MPAGGRRAEVLRPAALKVVNPATMKLPGAINTLHLESLTGGVGLRRVF